MDSMERGGITFCSKGFLAITGTNGKSTATALLDFMMKKGGFRTILGGNIGNALTEEILKLLEDSMDKKNADQQAAIVDYIVAEVSSFQLDSIKEFRPKVACIVNITPDHLDRYYSVQEYAESKTRIFENQKENDFLVLNKDDPETMKIAVKKLNSRDIKPKLIFFSRKGEVEGIYYREGRIFWNALGLSYELPIEIEEIKIKGVHNLENAMAATAMAILAGCSEEAIIDSLREFPGLEHRLEFVREIDGVKYFNDSKGTNVAAVMKSIESFANPIILIAGGRDKEGDFSLLRSLVKEKVKAVVLIGEAKEKIKNALKDVTETLIAEDFEEAIYTAREIAVKGDVVLLSPACASFDMFINFEDRGRQFKKIVMEMKMGKYDKWLLIVTVLLIIFGALMIYSTTSVVPPMFDKNGITEFYYFKKHVFTIILGFFFMFIAYMLKPSFIKKMAIPLLVVSFILLILVFIPNIGVSAGGAKRWIRLWPSTFQPSELVKLSMVIFLSWYMSLREYKTDSFVSFLKPILVMIIFQLAILKQPDFGAAMSLSFFDNCDAFLSLVLK